MPFDVEGRWVGGVARDPTLPGDVGRAVQVKHAVAVGGERARELDLERVAGEVVHNDPQRAAAQLAQVEAAPGRSGDDHARRPRSGSA